KKKNAEARALPPPPRHPGQQGDAARHVKPTDAHLQSRSAEAAAKVERAGELVGLHAHQRDQGSATLATQAANDALGMDAPVGLIVRGNGNVGAVTQHASRAAILGKAVEASQRVGRNGRAQPLNGITLVVVMRGFDQHQIEDALGRRHWSSPLNSDRWLDESRCPAVPLACQPRSLSLVKGLTARSGESCQTQPKWCMWATSA